MQINYIFCFLVNLQFNRIPGYLHRILKMNITRILKEHLYLTKRNEKWH